MSDINSLKDFLPLLSSQTLDHFMAFFKLIEKYNLKMNLISRGALLDIASKHFVDSYEGIQVLNDLDNTNKAIFDLGSGNGFPGLIAAILRPDLDFILVDRDQRKAEFLRIAYSHLGLTNVEVHSGNITDLADSSCSLAISRAMAPLPRFLLEARSCVGLGGQIYMFKGENWTTELGSCPPQMFDYWSVKMQKHYILPDKNRSNRFIVLCEKLK